MWGFFLKGGRGEIVERMGGKVLVLFLLLCSLKVGVADDFGSRWHSAVRDVAALVNDHERVFLLYETWKKVISFGEERLIDVEMVEDEGEEEEKGKGQLVVDGAVKQEVRRGRCRGKVSEDGGCICSPFQDGENCSTRLFARCLVLQSRPAIDRPQCISSASISAPTTKYDPKLDGDVPCLQVKDTDKILLSFSLDCYIFDPNRRNGNGT